MRINWFHWGTNLQKAFALKKNFPWRSCLQCKGIQYLLNSRVGSKGFGWRERVMVVVEHYRFYLSCGELRRGSLRAELLKLILQVRTPNVEKIQGFLNTLYTKYSFISYYYPGTCCTIHLLDFQILKDLKNYWLN